MGSTFTLWTLLAEARSRMEPWGAVLVGIESRAALVAASEEEGMGLPRALSTAEGNLPIVEWTIVGLKVGWTRVELTEVRSARQDLLGWD